MNNSSFRRSQYTQHTIAQKRENNSDEVLRQENVSQVLLNNNHYLQSQLEEEKRSTQDKIQQAVQQALQEQETRFRNELLVNNYVLFGEDYNTQG